MLPLFSLQAAPTAPGEGSRQALWGPSERARGFEAIKHARRSQPLLDRSGGARRVAEEILNVTAAA